MKKQVAILAACITAASLAGLAWQGNRNPAPPRSAAPGIAGWPTTSTTPAVLETAHYRVHHTAEAAHARQVADAAESLHEAYAAFFSGQLPTTSVQEKRQLFLYRDRDEFKRNNRSRPWAEAYYLAPLCHAYFDPAAANPRHWMLHEAVHQLNREWAGFPRRAWSDEGLASYFGSSRLVSGRLQAGDPDPHAYPIWWLAQQRLSGDLGRDLREGRIIPLQQIIDGRGGPDINAHFNLYYIHYWSLSHFLIHHDGGRHAPAFRRLLAEGGDAMAFEARFGPLSVIQPLWYAHLVEQVARARR